MAANQTEHVTLLFKLLPDIQKAHNLTQAFNDIFKNATDKTINLTRLTKEYEKIYQSAFKFFKYIIKDNNESQSNHIELF